MIVIARTALDVKRLAAIKVDPADLVDDGVDYAGRTIQKPWGHEREVFRNGAFSTWQLHLNARAETSMHAHPGKDTMLIVSEGSVIVETLQSKRQLTPGDAVVIERGVFHKTFALTAAVLIEVESSGNRRDLVRLSDRYGRGQGYGVVYKAERVG